MTKASSGSERRRAKRRPILSTFSVFAVVPRKGVHRLQVHDISELGLGFDLDIEGEPESDFQIKPGEPIDFRFYLNQSLYIPLSVQAVRVEERGGIRRVGAEFTDKSDENYKAFASFLQALDRIADVVVQQEG